MPAARGSDIRRAAYDQGRTLRDLDVRLTGFLALDDAGTRIPGRPYFSMDGKCPAGP
ncbi:hypothetical protein V1460_08175 [Streptomyces sp. SCSIO 30461]|uniref:hypothetical protein n=1 Tax=Streptomyces sp. SCSIO 30461 TaxID=3118085 RepID=UPI0030D5FB83